MLYLITQRKSPNMKIRLVQQSIRNPSEIPLKSSTVVTGSAAIQNCTVADFSSFSSSLRSLPALSSREKTSAKERWTKNQVKIKIKYSHLKVPERKKMFVYNGDAWRRHDYRRVNIMHLIWCASMLFTEAICRYCIVSPSNLPPFLETRCAANLQATVFGRLLQTFFLLETHGDNESPPQLGIHSIWLRIHCQISKENMPNMFCLESHRVTLRNFKNCFSCSNSGICPAQCCYSNSQNCHSEDLVQLYLKRSRIV